MNDAKLSEKEMDALQEMGNISTGNATTALSKLLNKNIEMNIPETRFVPIRKFADEVGGPEKIISGIYLQLLGDLEGEALFIFSKESTLELIDLILGKKLGTTKTMDEFDESAFKEMGNILTGSFLNALSRMLDVKILSSIPHFATDMAQSVLDSVIAKIGKCADEVLCVKTKINVEGHKINGEFLVLFDETSLKKMLKTLHKKYGHIVG
ncbi:chemotaxis protein CheC [Candidatus Woesearchaeota archaeon]|nr:chemotaxis protein CheC [Candidatus Woesearchaeota archaeon]